VVHLMLGIVGKRLLNPGMLSAWLVHVPWGIWTIWLLVRAGVITNPYWNDYLLQGLEIIVALAAAGLFLWIRYRRRQPQR
jgi:hypothetical protein